MTITVEDLHRQLDVLEAKLDNTPCGRGWVGTKPPGCKRAGKAGATAAKAEPKAKATKGLGKGKAAPQQVEKGGALTLATKPTGDKQQKPPKGGQDQVDRKWANSNPSDADVSGWLKDTALRNSDPSDDNVNAIALDRLQNLTGTHPSHFAKAPKYIRDINDAKSWAEAVYKKEQSTKKQKGGDLPWQSFSMWSGDDDKKLATAQRQAKSGKTPEARAKAQKQADKLGQRKKDDEQTSKDAAERVNATRNKPKKQRIAELQKQYADEFSKAKSEAKELNDKVKKGDSKAVMQAAKRTVYGLEGFTTADLKGGEVSVKEAVKSHLQKVYQQGGGDASTLGIDPKQSLTQSELKTAYRKAAAKAHPDRGGSAEQFRQVNEAYERMRQNARKDAIRAMHSKLDTLELQLELRKYGRLHKRGKVGTW